MKSSKSYLITGGTGYIGSNVTRLFVDSGAEVHLLVRPSSALPFSEPLFSKVKIHVHDGTTGHLVEIMQTAMPDAVVHLASNVVAEHRPEDITSLIEANVLLGVQILEAMAVSGVKSIVNTGTYWQHYGNTVYDPVCLYAATKQAFEDLLTYYVNCRELKAITLTIFDTYGPDDPRPKLFNYLFHLCRQPADEQAPLALTAGEQLVDLVHVDDVAAAYLAATALIDALSTSEHRHFSVSSGKRPTLKEVVSLIENVAGHHLTVEWGAKPYRFREIMFPWTGGEILPGWKPKIDLRSGLNSILKPTVIK